MRKYNENKIINTNKKMYTNTSRNCCMCFGCHNIFFGRMHLFVHDRN